MANSLSANFNVGTANISSLVKSASSLAYDAAEAQDETMAQEYSDDHSDASYASYTAYLKSRITTLENAGTGASILHAATLTGELNTATKSNITFDVQGETAQVLDGTASDSDKLNYLNQAIAAAQASGDPDLMQSLQVEAGNFQQSMEYTAEETASTDVTTVEDQVSLADSTIDSQYKTIETAYKGGDMKAVNSAIQTWMSNPQVQAYMTANHINPKASMSMATITQAYISGKAYVQSQAYSAYSAIGSPDAEAKANTAALNYANINNGNTSYSTAFGSQSLTTINALVSNPGGYHASIEPLPGGGTKINETANAIVGWRQEAGIGGTSVQVPVYSGTSVGQYDKMNSSQQAAVKSQLTKLGFTPNASNGTTWSSGQYLAVQTSQTTAKWMNLAGTDIAQGSTIYLIPTANGYEFQGNDGRVFGISVDKNGLPALYGSDNNGEFHQISGAYGFNAKTAHPMPPSQIVKAANKAGQDIMKGVKVAQATGNAANAKGTTVSPSTDKALKAKMDNQSIFSGLGTELKDVLPETRNWFNSTFSAPARKPMMTQRAGGGFNFTDAKGNPISAYSYSRLTGTPFTQLVNTMALAGDNYSAQILPYVNNQGIISANTPLAVSKNISALTWGAGITEPTTLAQGQVPITPVSQPKASTGLPTAPTTQSNNSIALSGAGSNNASIGIK